MNSLLRQECAIKPRISQQFDNALGKITAEQTQIIFWHILEQSRNTWNVACASFSFELHRFPSSYYHLKHGVFYRHQTNSSESKHCRSCTFASIQFPMRWTVGNKQFFTHCSLHPQKHQQRHSNPIINLCTSN